MRTCLSCVLHGGVVRGRSVEPVKHQLLVFIWNKSLFIYNIHRWLVLCSTFWEWGCPTSRSMASCRNRKNTSLWKMQTSPQKSSLFKNTGCSTHKIRNTVTILLQQQGLNMKWRERGPSFFHIHSAAVPSKPLQQLGKHVNTMKIHHLATGNSSVNCP